MNTKRTLTFKTILLSYLTICAVLIGITGVGYGSSISYMRKEIQKSAQQEMKEFTSQIENNIQQTYKICDTLAVGTDLQTIGNIEGKFTPEQIQEAMKLQQTMQKVNIQNNLYQNLHIYFNKSNTILSMLTQMREGEQDIALFCKGYGITAEEFDEILSGEHGLMHQVLDNNMLWLIRPVYDAEGNLQASIIAEYKASMLVENPNEDRILSIKTAENKNLQCIGILSDSERISLEWGANTFDSIRINNSNYISVGRSMNLFNWKCTLAIPNTLFWGELRRFVLVLAGEVAVLLVAAILCSWYFSKKTFLPIGSLMKDNRNLSRKAKSSQNIELTRYLLGVTEEFPDENSSNIKSFISESEEGYRMAILHMGEESHQILGQQTEGLQDENLEQFVLENLLGDQVFHRYPGFVAEVEKNYVIFLGSRGRINEEKEVRQLFEGLEKFYQENFRISMRVIVGKKETDFKRIKEIYDLLMESIQYLDFWNGQEELRTGIYVYGEIFEAEEDVSFPAYINGSRKLLNCLESEDFKGAYKELDAIYREAFPKNRKYLQQNMYQMYGLIGMLVAKLDIHANEEDQKFYQTLHYEERLFRIQSMHELLTESREIFERIIEYRESQTKEHEPEWLEQMLVYIEDHYQDLDLNVSKLAAEFDISVPHLSRAFKSYMEKGVLDYIHGIRLAHAKEMLKNDGTIKNVALAVGYSDSQALTRAFKRYEGITPSQYKELLKKPS